MHGAVAGGDSQDAYYSQGVGGLWRDGVHRVHRIRRVEGLWRGCGGDWQSIDRIHSVEGLAREGIRTIHRIHLVGAVAVGDSHSS